MRKISLGIGLFVFFTGFAYAAEQTQDSIVTVLIKTTSTWDGAALPLYPKEKPEITILKITIPSETALPNHFHPVINAGVLVKGQLTVKTVDNKTLYLKTGDPIVEVVNTWHTGKNEGTEPAEIIVFYAGSESSLITVKEETKSNPKLSK